MPFLLPAIITLICDICVVWLSTYTQHHDLSQSNTNDAGNSSSSDNNIYDNTNSTDHWVYYSIDLYCGSVSAIMRMCILCLPLLYHSYTGRALQNNLWYRTIYIGMALLVLLHIISFIVINPKSIESVVILPGTDSEYEYRRLWLILLLSCISLFFHHILLRHVRSTAPTRPMMLRMLNLQQQKNRNSNNYSFLCGNYIHNTVQPTMYFAVRTAAAAASSAAIATKNAVGVTATRTSSFINKSAGTMTSTNGISTLPFADSDNDESNTNGTNDHNYNENGIIQEPALINAMNEFLMDMQIRLQRTKQDWTSRLEDFGHRIHQQQQTQNGSNNAVSTTSSTLSPFRVLLQLFAYEDVLDNHKLDTIFDLDDGVALTFYVPQLLSFLLHGALYTSPALEEWILNKCRKNIYFAHKCYWFLRAWCLEVPAESRPITPSISRRNSATSLSNNILTNGAIGTILSQQQQHVSNNDGSLPFLDEPASSEKKQLNNVKHGSSRNLCLPDNSMNNSSQSEMRQSSSVVLLPNGTVLPSPTIEKDKFLIPEERAMIERFMLRVKECGQIPAYKLEFGIRETTNFSNHFSISDSAGTMTPHDENSNSTRTTNDTTSYEPIDSPERPTNKLTYRGGNVNGVNGATTYPVRGQQHISSSNINADQNSAVMKSLVESGKIPIDPISGNPSSRHYNTLLSQQRSNLDGFHPIPNGNSDDYTSSMQAPIPSRCETEQFDKTPQFLDALIFLAENLYYIPRENRRETLQQQLRSLECELLPSNSIYLPIGSRNQYHRVWRIVAEECIAISTKERVPCIVALEVIDFSMSPASPFGANEEYNCGSSTLAVGNSIDNDTYINGTNRSVTSPTITSQNGLNDNDIVAEWRYGYRNPLRYVPFLDKVTTSVKVPFAKMKTQVRDHFNHLRDRGISEEMQALSSADALVGVRNQAVSKIDPVCTSVIVDRFDNGNNHGLESSYDARSTFADDGTIYKSKSDEPQSLSRMNSAGSFVSLGQWSSPSAIPLAVSDPDDHVQEDLNDVKFRLDTSLSNRSRRNSPLLYGSDQEDDPTEHGGNKSSGRPPIGRRPSTNLSLTKETNSKDLENSISVRPPPVVFRESWVAKQDRVRQKSAYGTHPGWKLLAILVKGNDDLRQEQLAAQLIQRMATILACERVNVWLCPYEIIATTDRGGVIEAIPDTISLDSLKKNDPNYTTLNDFFRTHYGADTDELASAKANFVESLAAYSMVCFILQLKDRHNGNILLDKWGHVIHIDFGFFFLSSPGKNAGFESAPFKLTREFMELLEGPNSHLFRAFRELCFKTFIALRRRCMEIILLVEMLKNGNEDLKCFRGRPDDAIQQLHDRFRLDLNDRACKEYVNCLIDDSIENWRTDWYDRYQRYFVGVL